MGLHLVQPLCALSLNSSSMSWLGFHLLATSITPEAQPLLPHPIAPLVDEQQEKAPSVSGVLVH